MSLFDESYIYLLADRQLSWHVDRARLVRCPCHHPVHPREAWRSPCLLPPIPHTPSSCHPPAAPLPSEALRPMIAFVPATAWRTASTLLRPSSGGAAPPVGRLWGLPRPARQPRPARMMADGPAEVGVAPPKDPAAETICTLFFCSSTERVRHAPFAPCPRSEGGGRGAGSRGCWAGWLGVAMVAWKRAPLFTQRPVWS